METETQSTKSKSCTGAGSVEVQPVTEPGAKSALCIHAIGLAVTASALGRYVYVQSPENQALCAGLNVIICAPEPARIQPVLDSILSPLTVEQSIRHAQMARIDPEKQQIFIERIKGERIAYEQRELLPDPDHLAYFDYRLAELQGALRPMMLLQNPPPGRLTLALKKSASASLLAVYDDITLTGLLDAARLNRGILDLELLGKSWRQEIFDGAFLEQVQDSATGAPQVNALALVRPATVARMLLSTDPLVAAFTDSCIIVNVPEAAPISFFAKFGHLVARWQKIASRFSANRQKQVQIIGMTQEAASV